jgi:peptidoglycan hydrolase CwlO-like protein
MEQTIIPEVQQAVDNLRAAIEKTEAKIVQLQETLKSQKKAVKTWKANIAKITGEKPIK